MKPKARKGKNGGWQAMLPARTEPSMKLYGYGKTLEQAVRDVIRYARAVGEMEEGK